MKNLFKCSMLILCSAGLISCNSDNSDTKISEDTSQTTESSIITNEENGYIEATCSILEDFYYNGTKYGWRKPYDTPENVNLSQLLGGILESDENISKFEEKYPGVDYFVDSRLDFKIYEEAHQGEQWYLIYSIEDVDINESVALTNFSLQPFSLIYNRCV